jgi:hypothetical protein
MGVHSKLAKEDKSAAAKAPSNLLKKLLPVRASTFATRNIWDIGTDDKKYICELAETTKEKAESAGEKFSERAFAGTYNIKPSTLRRWIVKYQDEKKSGQARWGDGTNSGRQPLLDEFGLKKVQGAIDKAYSTDKTMRWAAVRKLINAQIVANSRSRGIPVEGYDISESTFDRYKQTLDIGGRKSQLKTKARINAEKDCRNAFSMFCLSKAISEGLEPEMIFNWDATQYMVTPEGEFEVVVRKGSEEDKTPTEVSPGEMNYFVKLYHFHNAAGNVAVPVLCIANDKMGEEELVVHKAKGGGSTNDAVSDNNYSFICYTKTRSGNAAFYRWYAETVVIPFINQVRNFHECKNEDGTPMRAFVTCDGEAKQIEVFQEPEMVQFFKLNLIDFGKTPASCSGISQSSDVSRYFSNTKRAMKTWVHESNFKNAILEREILASFEKNP